MKNTLSKGGITKGFCIVLIFCIAAQLLCIMPNAAAENITVNENFDNGTAADISNGGLSCTSPNGVFNGWGNSTFSYADRDGGKALMMNKSAGACGYPGARLDFNLSRGFGLNSVNMLGRMEYSFDLYSAGTRTDALTISDIAFVLEDVNDKKSSGGFESYQTLVVSAKFGQFLTNGNKTKVGTFNKDQWNTVRIALDYMNNVIEYYINGIEYDFEFDFSGLKGSLIKGYFTVSCPDSNSGIDYGLDNFKAEFIPNETAQETLKAENLVIEDSDGYEVNISEFDGDNVIVSFDAINSYSDAKDIRIILAAYKNSDELTFVQTDTESLLPLSSKAVKKTFDYPKGVECTKLCAYVWDSKNMNPICAFVKAADSTSTKYVYLTDVTETFDGRERNYPILLSDDYPLIKLGNLAELIGGTSTADTLTKDGETVRFEPKNRLGEYNGGHLMLEREPIIRYGELYVPISVVQTALCYSMEYYRFDNRLELSSGTYYPDIEYVVYAHDYGAVGDGVTDDKDAILKAFNAAIMSNRPSKLVLDENKTYLVSEKVDTWAFFDLNGTENFVFDGNGSKILFESATNTFIGMKSCTNVQFLNIDAQWKEHTSTQGVITSIDADKKRFVLKIDDGYPLPPTDEWVTEFQGGTSAWTWAQIMEASVDRLKIMPTDRYDIESVREVGDRLYMIQLADWCWGFEGINTGDRFTIKTKQFAYDFSSTGKSGSINAIDIFGSKDITFDGVYVYGGHMFMCGAGFCDGRLVFKNSGMKMKDGQLEVTNADGIHLWRNRANLIVDNCTFLNSLDDHINTTGANAIVTAAEGDNKTFTVDYYLNWRIGDEMLVYDRTNHNVLGKGYLTKVEQSGSNYILTLDREVVGAKTDGTTFVYDVGACSRGTVIKNSTFKNSRRHAYIGRSPNTLFMNNTVENCGASAVAAMNELVTGGSNRCEGPFPSTFTMRDNTVTGVGTTPGFYPIEVKSWDAKNGESKAIDGLLLENNSVSVKNSDSFIVINSVKDLYMINNEVKYDGELLSTTKSIVISNSDIALIDGVNFDFTQNVNAVITIDGCNVDENNIKNINVNSGNTAKKYVIK